MHHPTDIILLAEEPVDTSPSEMGTNNLTPIDDGRWESGPNGITLRHNGKGNVAFGDGHAERIDNATALLPQHKGPQ
jgi:prepilin-type processing-associated H-X9-DG protein